MGMVEQANGEQKPGSGIDRTLIRQMLALTPRERAKAAVQASRNLSAIHAKIRRA
jgi:hypothetical protein